MRTVPEFASAVAQVGVFQEINWSEIKTIMQDSQFSVALVYHG